MTLDRTTQNAREQRILRVAMVAATLFAIMGIVWGMIIGSNAVMFDGVYSFISVLLSALALYISRVLVRPEDKRFHYGRAQLEPFTVVLQALVITVLCVYALFSAVNALRGGGSAVKPELAVGYAALSAGGCAGFWWYSKRQRAVLQSDLVQAESDQWLMDALLSVAVLVGFLIALLLERTSYRWLVPYIDPSMVILVSGYFLKTPLSRLVKSGRELLLMAPDEALQKQVEDLVVPISQHYDFDDVVIRCAKAGRLLSVDIGFITADGSRSYRITHLDEIRSEVEAPLRRLGYELWLTIEFTADRKWV